MRPIARFALLLVLTVAMSSLGTAGPAHAGGPTSVLLSVPGAGRVAALYYTDPAYETLANLVGLTEPGAAAESEHPHDTGQVVTLTWLIHDVQVWRVDRVNLDGAEAAWVETRMVFDEGSVWDARASWHRVDDRLAILLGRLMPDTGSTSASASVLDDLGVSGTAAAETADAAPSTTAGGDDFPDLTWLAAAALAGGALATALLRRRRGERPSPSENPVPTVDPAPADQLAWP